MILRVWLPDRPGALGQVASRIGSVRGDIAGVEVVDRGDGIAIDEVALLLPGLELVPMLVREVEQVDGVSVEEVRAVERLGDPRLDALAAAHRLGECRSPDELDRELVHLSRRELRAEWAALVGPPARATAGDAPPPAELDALVAGIAASAAVRDGAADPPDLAVGRLAHAGATLLVGRSDHPFRPRDRAQLAALARLGDTLGRLLSRVTVA